MTETRKTSSAREINFLNRESPNEKYRRASGSTPPVPNHSEIFSPGPKNPAGNKTRVKKSYKRLSVPLPLGDTETSPRQCDFCNQIRHVVPVAPPNAQGLPFLTKSCLACSGK